MTPPLIIHTTAFPQFNHTQRKTFFKEITCYIGCPFVIGVLLIILVHTNVQSVLVCKQTRTKNFAKTSRTDKQLYILVTESWKCTRE